MDELKKDAMASVIQRGIVRVTKSTERTREPGCSDVFVITGYLANGQLVELKQHMGELWGVCMRDSHNEETQTRAFEKVESLIKEIEAIGGLDIRAGVYII